MSRCREQRRRPRQIRTGCGAALGAVALLSGCAAGGSCPAPCTVAIAHLVELDHHLAIPLEADGKLVEAVMDTGATTSALTAKAADLLDARAVHNKDSSEQMNTPVVVSGFGADTMGTLVTVDELSLAGGRLRDAPFVEVRSLLFPDPRLTGLVGGDLLQNWDLDLSVGAGVLNLDLPQQAAPVAPWHDHTTRVPFDGRDSTWVRVVVMLDGHPLRAIIDTGAPYSLVAPETAAGQEVLATDRTGIAHGISGVPIPVRRHHYADLSIGGLSCGPIDAAVGAVNLRDVDMVLGLNVLRMARVYVAYQAGELLIDEGS